MFWIWLAAISVICGFIGRIITRSCNVNIIIDDMEMSRWEDILAIVFGLPYAVFMIMFWIFQKFND